MTTIKHCTVEEYIATFPKSTQKIFKQVRATIKKAAPGAEEVISYNIPALKLNGRGLVFYAAWKEHISLYPVPKGDEKFSKELSKYQAGKGTLQFPLDKAMPLSLITKIVKFHVKNNLEKAGKSKR